MAFCGHRAALWAACLAGLSAVVWGGLGLGAAACARFLAGLAGAVAVGLMWSVQVFESAQWWSVADAAEGASLVLLLLVAGAAHGGRPLEWRVAVALWLLGAFAVYEPDGALEVFVVVHRWAVWGHGHVSCPLVLAVTLVWLVRAGPSLHKLGLPACVSAGALPRAACLGVAVLWPYALAVALGAAVWASVPASVAVGLVCGCLARTHAGAPWLVLLWCGCDMGAATLLCCVPWPLLLWWSHLGGVLLYYCLLTPLCAASWSAGATVVSGACLCLVVLVLLWLAA